MTKLIVKDDKEREYYLKQIDDAFWRRMMNIALEHRDGKLMKKSYKEKKDNFAINIDDTVIYYTLFCPLIAYLLRVKRKVKRMICRL